MTKGQIKLRDFFAHYKGQPHQAAAVDLLASMMPASLLRADAEWVEAYRAAPPIKPTSTPNTWSGVMDAAKRAGARYPELVAAQWALESGWGQHTSGQHNYFGLKGPGTETKTTEVINGKTVTITAEFLNFRDLDECVTYLVERWHRDWRDYKGVNNAPNRDDAARNLVAQGYATDPAYASKLIKLMQQQLPLPAAVSKQQNGVLLKVPYFTQRDSAVAGQAARMCFSSSLAMVVAYLKPGVISGANADDQYLKRVLSFGDTTNAGAQLKALASYGIKARFVQNASFEALEKQLQQGRPVACGFLHHGPVTKPSGGGHWLTVIGYTDKAFIVNDPWGEIDLVKGTYISTKGSGIAYSRKNWGPRWMVEGPSTGWAILIDA
ncbi:MAG: glucosaminidase domain-containing protein [Vulcanococcus sp.]